MNERLLETRRGGGRRSPEVWRRLGLMLLVGVVGWAPAVGAGPAPPDAEPFHHGMVLGIFSRTDPGYFRRSLDEMKAIGVDSVSLIVPKVQKDVRSVGFYDDPWTTPTDSSLRTAAREAHRRGMRVLLFPIVYVENLKTGEWRGTLAPPDWDAWFRAYEGMILHYARLAAQEKIEYFSVGSELCSTEGFRDRWRGLIGKVRQAYRGKITYSANWDHLDPVSFGRDLDFLGMNAYYEVGRDSAGKEEDLVTRWRTIQEDVRRWRERNGGGRLVITEIGYPSRRGAAVDPWNYFGEGAADEEEQAKCYRAFVRAWNGETMLGGVYFYLWWGEGGAGDRDYTPRGKPAQQVIESWYRGRAGSGTTAPVGTAEVAP